jgi:hypothetical protein
MVTAYSCKRQQPVQAFLALTTRLGPTDFGKISNETDTGNGWLSQHISITAQTNCGPTRVSSHLEFAYTPCGPDQVGGGWMFEFKSLSQQMHPKNLKTERATQKYIFF